MWLRSVAVGGSAVGVAALNFKVPASPPQLHYHRCQHNDELIQKCPKLREQYSPTKWCSNAVLQLTVHTFKKRIDSENLKLSRQLLNHADGGTTALDWVEAPSGSIPEYTATTPTVVLLHTITGKTDDCYGMGTLIKQLVHRGWRVVIHARRGCGDLKLTTPKFDLIGDSSDTQDAVDTVRKCTGANTPIAMVGLSAGSGALFKYLGDQGTDANVIGAVAVSPGYRVPDAYHNCSPFFGKILTKKLQEHFLQENEPILTATPDLRAAYDASMEATTLPGFVESSFIFGGSETIDAHYANADAFRVSHNVAVPTLAINALDDPVCSSKNIQTHAFDSNHNLILATTPRGSHLAFYHDWDCKSWSDDVVCEFLQALLEKNKH
eukprot:m.63047 g.63047  ORF g.63047 m.63047 type:complete len:380 (+) comp23234_c0_seq1:160-1299(+)